MTVPPRFARDNANPNNWQEGRRHTSQPMHKTFARLWKYLGRERKLLLLALGLMLLSNAFALVGPKLSGLAIDAIGIQTGEVRMDLVLIYAGAMVVLYALSALLQYLQSKTSLKLSRRVTYQLRKDVFNKLMTLPVRYFDERQVGDIISVISYDIDTVNMSLSTDIVQIATSSFTILFSLIMMLTILPQLVLVFCVTVPISILFTRFITHKVRPLFRKRSWKLGEMNGYAEEMIGGQKTTRAYGREEQIIEGFRKKNREATHANDVASGVGGSFGSGMNFINNLSLTLVSIFGGILLLRGGAMLGDISAFVQYSRKFTGPINEIGNIISDLQSAFAAAERVFALLDEEPEKPDAENALVLEHVAGDVEMSHVKFGYDPQKTIIKDLSLRADPGSLIAIVGPTGAGKTTIINLLMRFYDIESGTIRIDGHSIYDVTRKSLRRSYTMVLQDTWLFDGTVFENIAYGKDGVTMDEVVAAAKTAGIHGFVRRLPKGYDTMITGGGTGISKGQKQMLTIARAMLLDSKMLILDEATSNVDTQTERRIQKAMRELMKDRTCFVIAHRLSTIRHADNILVMKGGNVVEQGKHEELMAKKGEYAKLYKSQFESY